MDDRRQSYDRMELDQVRLAVRDILEDPPKNESGMERIDRALVVAALVLTLVAVMSYVGSTWLWPEGGALR